MEKKSDGITKGKFVKFLYRLAYLAVADPDLQIRGGGGHPDIQTLR